MSDRGDQVDRLLEELARWSALERAEEAAADRMREGWLRRQAAEEATWAGLLADLAERRATVVVHLAGERVHRGRVLAAGIDFVLLAAGGDGSRPTPLLLSLAEVTALRQEAGEPPVGPSKRRAGEEPATLASLLASLSGERRQVRVVLTGGEGVTGDLESVGEDLMTIRIGNGRQGVTYLRLTAVVEVSLLGSG